jgi:hypothetical protein
MLASAKALGVVLDKDANRGVVTPYYRGTCRI